MEGLVPPKLFLVVEKKLVYFTGTQYRGNGSFFITSNVRKNCFGASEVCSFPFGHSKIVGPFRFSRFCHRTHLFRAKIVTKVLDF